jgi:hypothetical protein
MKPEKRLDMTTTNIRYRVSRRPLLPAMLAVFAVVATAAAGYEAQPPRVNADAATLADFTKRVNAYAELHKKVDNDLKEPSRDSRPEDFIEHERAFARLMQKERPYAQPGDIFTKPMRNIIRRLLAGVFRGPKGREIKKSILDEYTANVPLRVNTQYPENSPFSTVPPQILQGLPKLPDGLEYRFIGRRLILLDGHARLIVDIVERVFP